jgi:hypothetical protein
MIILPESWRREPHQHVDQPGRFPGIIGAVEPDLADTEALAVPDGRKVSYSGRSATGGSNQMMAI